MRLNSIFTILAACLVISGCAYKGDLTREKAHEAIDKFMSGKGTFKIIDDETDTMVKADHQRVFRPKSTGGKVHFNVSNFTGTDSKGKSWTIPDGSGIATIIQDSSSGSWYLSTINILPKGADASNLYFVTVDKTIY